MSKEWKETVNEINEMRAALKSKFGEYTTNAIERLIMARIKLETLDQSVVTEPTRKVEP